jgi:phage-related minor tail protein
MANRTRRLDVEIGSEAKGDGFKKTESDAERLARKLKESGEKGGKGLKDGVEEGTKSLGDKLRSVGLQAGEKLKSGVSAGAEGLESVGETAGDAMSDGFSLDSLVDSAKSVFQGLAGKLGPVAAGAGVAIAGAFAVGFMNDLENEAVTDKLAAQLGGEKWGKQAGEIAGDLYLDGFGESMAEVADSTRKVLSSGLIPFGAGKKQLEDITAEALTFVDVLDQDLTMSVNGAAQMIRTGLAKDSTEAFDLLTTGIQLGADKAEDLAETFNEYSTMFRDIGIDGSDAIGLITQGLRAGARDADTVADALKEFAIRAQDGSDASAEGFKAIGLSAKEMTSAVAEGGPRAREALDKVLDGLRNIEDPAKRNAAAVALFGTKAEDLGDSLFSLDLDTAADQLGDFEGSTAGLGDAYDNASSKIETFRREALQKLTLFIGDEVIPKLDEFGGWLTEEVQPAVSDVADDVENVLMPALREMAGFFEDNPWAVKAVVILAALAAGITILVKVVGFFASLIPVAKVFGAVIGALGFAVTIALALLARMGFLLGGLLGPFLLIAGAIWAVIRNLGTLGRVAKAVWGWIVDHWPTLIRIFGGPVAIIMRIGDVLREVWKIGVAAFHGIAGAVGWVIDRVSSLLRWIGKAASGLSSLTSKASGSGFFGLGGLALSGIFDVGGVVPGPVGSPQLILAHGGETILPTHDPAAMRAMAGSVSSAPVTAGPAGDTYYVEENHYHIAGSVLTERDLVGRLNKRGRGGRGVN